jgi:hypothetical protein
MMLPQQALPARDHQVVVAQEWCQTQWVVSLQSARAELRILELKSHGVQCLVKIQTAYKKGICTLQIQRDFGIGSIKTQPHLAYSAIQIMRSLLDKLILTAQNTNQNGHRMLDL